MRKERNRKRKYGWMAAIMVAAVLGVAIWLNWGWICDFYWGMTYVPSSEMEEIRDKLGLTERGEFLFRAARPVLNEREEFNENCRAGVEVEAAVLGCFTEGNIYVYNITEEELEGIRELTTAHELLHAVWARMSEGERSEFTAALEEVLRGSQELSKEIELYDADERPEELYVRAGTEVKELPEELERHFGEIFRDQDKIVEFYESYIAVFNNIKSEMESLAAEMEEIKVEIGELTAEYERRSAQLNADITSFNSCAEVSGCFRNSEEFYARRRVLIREQTALGELYEKLDELTEKYNEKVAEYNEDVTQTRKLNDIVNSSNKIENQY